MKFVEVKILQHITEVVSRETVNIQQEYNKIYNRLHRKVNGWSLFDYYCANFREGEMDELSFTLKEFSENHNYKFIKKPECVNLELLLMFCEYVLNLNQRCHGHRIDFYFDGLRYGFEMSEYIKRLLNMLNYQSVSVKNNMWIWVIPKNIELDAILIAEHIETDVKMQIVQYYHPSNKGNLLFKKGILCNLGALIEPKRAILNKLNQNLEQRLFQFLNYGNIRHNNVDPNSKFYCEKVSQLNNIEAEELFDTVFIMSMVALILLEHENIVFTVEKYKNICVQTKNKNDHCV